MEMVTAGGNTPWQMKDEYKFSASDFHPNDAGSLSLSNAYMSWSNSVRMPHV